jgi:hypothetical protein
MFVLTYQVSQDTMQGILCSPITMEGEFAKILFGGKGFEGDSLSFTLSRPVGQYYTSSEER